jgi:serine/threonine protein kinase
MIGNVVGSYKITEKIGEGGMGAVFKGIDLMLEREVAIKMLRPELASQPQVVERFRSEAVTLAKLNHPNIATLFSFLRQGEDFFMVMEFVRGETLDSLIRRTGAMSCDRAVALLNQALDGIDHAHRMGIIHRDIKPANMMLTENGTLKVMDFGIARVLGTSRMTKQGNIVGTIEYMSPEQVRGQETDARSDIYSLGILLYEMLTGRVPFSSDSEYDLMRMQIENAPEPPRVFCAQIPQPVEQAIMRSLAKRAEARFQGAGEFRAALSGALSGVAPTIIVTPAAAPPATRLGDLKPAAPASGVAAKETRLANEAASAPNYQINPTRLAPDAPTPSFAGAGYQPAAQANPAGKTGTRIFIAVAALVVVAAIGVSIVVLSGLNKTSKTPSPPTEPVTTQPSALSPSSSSSSGSSQQPTPAQQPPQPVNQIEPAKPANDRVAGSAPPSVENPNPTKPAKVARKETDAEAAARKERERKIAEARRLLNQ